MTGRVIRLLVTGSRKWRWPAEVERMLDEQRARLQPGDTLVAVHGGCPEGPDLDAHEWATFHHAYPNPALAAVDVEVHIPDWDNCDPGYCKHGPRKRRKDGTGYCQAAGMRRNAAMVATRPDRWIGFCLDDSGGTDGCIALAREARIPGRACYDYTPEKGAA